MLRLLTAILLYIFALSAISPVAVASNDKRTTVAVKPFRMTTRAKTHDYRNRSFDPATGRFLQRDPVLGGDPLYNPYCFPGNNPVTGSDPMGTGDEDNFLTRFVKRFIFGTYPGDKGYIVKDKDGNEINAAEYLATEIYGNTSLKQRTPPAFQKAVGGATAVQESAAGTLTVTGALVMSVWDEQARTYTRRTFSGFGDSLAGFGRHPFDTTVTHFDDWQMRVARYQCTGRYLEAGHATGGEVFNDGMLVTGAAGMGRGLAGLVNPANWRPAAFSFPVRMAPRLVASGNQAAWAAGTWGWQPAVVMLPSGEVVVNLSGGFSFFALAAGSGGGGEEPWGPVRVRRMTNPKHHPKSASPEPSNAQELFDRAIVDKSGVRWAKDAKGTIHRFSKPRNAESHWNGSTSGTAPLRLEDIPIEIRRAL